MLGKPFSLTTAGSIAIMDPGVRPEHVLRAGIMEELIMAGKVKSAFKGDVSKQRLEFLFDGVFAIALTILVLELKLPELKDGKSVSELGLALQHHGSTFFSYILSIVLLSAFWFSHNQIYAKLTRINNTMWIIHIGLLTLAASFPFCSHLFGRYTGNPLASLIYFGATALYYLGMLMLIIVARKQKLFEPQIPAGDIRKLLWEYLGSAAFLILAYMFIYVLRVFGK